MTKNILLISLLVITTGLFSQSVGDTIVVKSLNHASAVRDTMVSFPNVPGQTYEKILMKYNMRCKDAKVSTGSNRNLGCGEWDYSCNTYIHDSSRVDSLLSFQTAYSISSFSGDTFYYSTTPVNNYYVNYQSQVSLDSIISQISAPIGTIGSSTISNDIIATDEVNGKSMFIYKASELTAFGLSAGTIDALEILSSAGSLAEHLRIRIKATSDSILSDSTSLHTGFTEVYYSNSTINSGGPANRFQFHTPFNWNGTSNLIVEFSLTNNQLGISDILENSTSTNMALHIEGDQSFYFSGSSYIEANNYKGIGGNNDRTVEAWIKTSQGSKEIVSWGRDAGNQKWNFRLNGDGTLRVEVNGGNKIGTTDLRDNKWHHVACSFTGTTIVQANLYVDGVLETTSSQTGTAVNTDITNGINVRVSRGTNNRYFTGNIDEVRIWDAALSASEIKDWMFRSINSSHPKYSNLKLYYPLNDGSGTTVTDETSNQNDGTIINGNQWVKFNGIDLFKELQSSYSRPIMEFFQGTYQLTINTDTVLDTVPNFQHSVTAYQIFPKTGTIQSDSIASNTNFYYQAGYEFVFDTNGVKLDSFLVSPQGYFPMSTMEYFRRYPMRFEIMSFVTPYGIGLNFGQDGHTWTFDLTDFSPVLKGNKRLTMEWGGQWQEEMDIQFLFIVGTPPRDVLDIEQIWRVTKPSYSTIEQERAFEPRNYNLLSSGKAFKIRSAITGHGQQGEFIARNHRISLNNGANNYQWQVWTECADNPIYPQGGTWIYDRAGWCPGAATDLKETNITNVVSAGSSVPVDYTVVSASGSSSYIVNHQLVTYGDPNASLDAAVVDIKAPTSAIEYSRTNFICTDPTIVIKNTGSSSLSTLTIRYWLNGNETNPEVYSWTGNLAFLAEEEVILPAPSSLWRALQPDNNRFFVEVVNPNGLNDEYQYNNKMSSSFSIPDVVPGEFVIYFRSNSAAYESSYFLLDADGKTKFQRTSMVNNTTYRDTLSLDPGCYQLFINDTDDDGIDFWANNDGAGSARLLTTDNKLVTNIEPDFGKSVIYNFTIDYPLSYEEIEGIRNEHFNVYPNPATDQFVVESDNLSKKDVSIYNGSGQRMNLSFEKTGDKLIFNTSGLPKGIYIVQLRSDSKVSSRKVVVQ